MHIFTRALFPPTFFLWTLFFAAGSTFCFSSSAQAQSDVESRIEGLLADSFSDYDTLQLSRAQAKLQQAIELIEEFGIQNSAAADVYMLLGVVLFAGSGDANMALNPFVEALLIDQDAAINPYYSTPGLEEILEQARAILPPNTGGEVTQNDTPEERTIQDDPPEERNNQNNQNAPIVEHRAVSNTNAGQPLSLHASVPLNVPVDNVEISYRPYGDAFFYPAEMIRQPDGTSYIGEIPSSATQTGIQVEYYIVAFDRAGQPIGGAGSPNAPNVVIILGGADPDIDNNNNRRNQRRDRNNQRGNSRNNSFYDNQNLSDEAFHLTLGGGTGVGIATGELNANAKVMDINSGTATTPFHLALEFGAVVAPSIHLVPFARAQMVFLTDGMELLPLFGMKVRYFFDDTMPTRLYVEGGAGYGEISHLVRLTALEEPGGDREYDTTNEGPFHVGVGFGAVQMLGQTFGLAANGYLMGMFGDAATIQADLTGGIYISF